MSRVTNRDATHIRSEESLSGPHTKSDRHFHFRARPSRLTSVAAAPRLRPQRVAHSQHRTLRSRALARARAMSSLVASLGRVVPGRAERRGKSPTARLGIAGMRATVVAHARAVDDLDAPPPTRLAPEDSRWVEAPAPPASSVRDVSKKVRLRLRRAPREITKCRICCRAEQTPENISINYRREGPPLTRISRSPLSRLPRRHSTLPG